MPYCNRLDLLTTYGPDLLAQAATPAPYCIDGRLIEDAIRVGTGAYSQDEQDAATRALATIDAKITSAAVEIDGYALRRYAPAQLATLPQFLVELNIRMAFYKLWRTPGDELRRDYEDCIKSLTHISEGRIVLLVAPVPEPQGVGMPDYSEGGIFDREAINAFS